MEGTGRFEREEDKEGMIINIRFLKNQDRLGSRASFPSVMIAKPTRKEKHEQKWKGVGGGG